MPLPDLPCLCANLRRAARALTQIYEEALRPVGLRGSQFTILQTLSLAGELTQGQMAHILAMDSTTLTRTLAIMERQGWIARREGADRREWRIQLSKPGRSKVRARTPPLGEGPGSGQEEAGRAPLGRGHEIQQRFNQGGCSPKELKMLYPALFGITIAFSFVVWGLVARQYFWPALRGRSAGGRGEAHPVSACVPLHGTFVPDTWRGLA